METPSFTFRLERVKSLRERAEARAQEDLAHELRLRLRGEAMLREATYAASAATQAGRDAVLARASGMDLIAAQAFIERAERDRREAALDLDRQEAEVAARRTALQAAARDRQVMDKLEERQRADHNRDVGPPCAGRARRDRPRRAPPRSRRRMSVDAVVARVAELQQLMGAPPAPAQTSTPSAFASQLATATAATSAPTATTASAGLMSVGASELPADVPFGAEITAAAKKHGIDPALLAGLVKQESGFNPNAGSPAGARGLTQLMPGTAAGLGVSNVLDPAQSLDGGAKYLRQQLDAFGGDVTRALAAYNAGPGAVQRYGGVPPYAETQNYVRVVQANAAQYRAGGAAPSIL